MRALPPPQPAGPTFCVRPGRNRVKGRLSMVAPCRCETSLSVWPMKPPLGFGLAKGSRRPGFRLGPQARAGETQARTARTRRTTTWGWDRCQRVVWRTCCGWNGPNASLEEGPAGPRRRRLPSFHVAGSAAPRRCPGSVDARSEGAGCRCLRCVYLAPELIGPGQRRGRKRRREGHASHVDIFPSSLKVDFAERMLLEPAIVFPHEGKALLPGGFIAYCLR